MTASDYPYLDHAGLLAFSHRGGTSDWPENTMPAFQTSVDLGYLYLETDVHVSADGVLYAFHDADLQRTTGVDGYIADLDSTRIDQLLVDGVAPIPRLSEILSTWPSARLNIDTKSDASVLPLVDTLRAHNAIDRVCVGSFSDRRIQRCRKELGPELCTSMGPFEFLRLFFASKGLADPSFIVAPCAQIPPKFSFIDVTTPKLVEVAHECDMHIHVWTVDDATQMNSLIDMNVDGIMTDEPRLLRQVSIDRGVWAPPRLQPHATETAA